MPKLQAEESNKNRLAIIADNELRELIDRDQAARFMKWWDKWRAEVGWRRMSKLLTIYSKEFRTPYVKEIKEDLEDVWIY